MLWEVQWHIDFPLLCSILFLCLRIRFTLKLYLCLFKFLFYVKLYSINMYLLLEHSVLEHSMYSGHLLVLITQVIQSVSFYVFFSDKLDFLTPCCVVSFSMLLLISSAMCVHAYPQEVRRFHTLAICSAYPSNTLCLWEAWGCTAIPLTLCSRKSDEFCNIYITTPILYFYPAFLLLLILKWKKHPYYFQWEISTTALESNSFHLLMSFTIFDSPLFQKHHFFQQR